MTHPTFSLAIGAAALALPMAHAAVAADKKPSPPPAVLAAVVRCQTIADAAERLKCYDGASAALSAALDSRKLYAMDRSQVEATRRTRFGLPLTDAAAPPGAEPVRQIEATLAGAALANDGDWTFVLEDNAVWRQTDEVPLGHTPRRGDKVTIRVAALGSHKLTIGAETVRVVRVR